MKGRLNLLQSLILLAIGAILIWLSFRKLSIAELWEQLRNGNYAICLPVFGVSLTGYLCRSLRWKMMTDALGQTCRKRSLLAALCMGYAVNFAVPRLGEITRLLVIKKTDGVKLDLSLITVIFERIFDVIVLALLTALAVFTQRERILGLLDEVGRHFTFRSPLPLLLLGISVLLAFLFLLYLLRRNRKVASVLDRYQQVWPQLSHLLLSPLFWLYTLIIWSCYFLMTYLWFFLFRESSSLTLTDAFLLMVVGSAGRSLPIQGGSAGAYHFLVSQTFVLTGLSLLTGNALALVIHGAQTVFTFLTGTLSYGWMMLDQRNTSE